MDDTTADLVTPDGLYPVIGGPNRPGGELTYTGLSLAGTTLTVTMKVADLRAATQATTLTQIPGASSMEYVTRWVMATPSDAAHPYTMFYAAMVGNDTVKADKLDRVAANCEKVTIK